MTKIKKEGLFSLIGNKNLEDLIDAIKDPKTTQNIGKNNKEVSIDEATVILSKIFGGLFDESQKETTQSDPVKPEYPIPQKRPKSDFSEEIVPIRGENITMMTGDKPFLAEEFKDGLIIYIPLFNDSEIKLNIVSATTLSFLIETKIKSGDSLFSLPELSMVNGFTVELKNGVDFYDFKKVEKFKNARECKIFIPKKLEKSFTGFISL